MDPFEKKKDPMDALSALTQKVREVLDPLGVKVEQFWFAPSPGDGPHMAQGVFTVDRDAAFKTQEERNFDEQFKEIAIREQYEKEQQKIEDAKQNLAGLLGNLEGGFLGDGDETHPEGTTPKSEIDLSKVDPADLEAMRQSIAEELSGMEIVFEEDPTGRPGYEDDPGRG